MSATDSKLQKTDTHVTAVEASIDEKAVYSSNFRRLKSEEGMQNEGCFTLRSPEKLGRKITAAPILLLLGLLAASRVAHADSFDLTTIDVPYPGAFQTTPTGINDNGQIAGFYLTFGLAAHGFLLSNRNFSTYDFTTSNCCTDFHAINNLNQVVGYGRTVSFLFSGGNFSTISVPGSTFTSANGINDAGQIVGDTMVSNVAEGFILNGNSFALIPNVTRATGIS
jgi:uncharacterized membrane protein